MNNIKLMLTDYGAEALYFIVLIGFSLFSLVKMLLCFPFLFISEVYDCIKADLRYTHSKFKTVTDAYCEADEMDMKEWTNNQ